MMVVTSGCRCSIFDWGLLTTSEVGSRMLRRGQTLDLSIRDEPVACPFINSNSSQLHWRASSSGSAWQARTVGIPRFPDSPAVGCLLDFASSRFFARNASSLCLLWFLPPVGAEWTLIGGIIFIQNVHFSKQLQTVGIPWFSKSPHRFTAHLTIDSR